MKNLDFKKFKKISEDKDHAMLEHEDGHQLKIAKKPLSYRMRAHLAAIPMADGGEVKGNPKLEEAKKEPLDYEKVTEPLEYEPIKPKNPIDYVKMADGGEVADEPLSININKTPVLPDSLINPNAGQGPGINSIPETYTGDQPYGTPAPQAFPDRSLASQSPQSLPTLAPNSLAASSAELSAPQSPQNTSVLSDAPSLQQGYEQQQLGLKQEAQALGQQGAQEAKAIEANQANIEKGLQSFKDTSQKLNDDFNAISHDIQNGHISDDHYWANHSKLATGLGLIIAGFNPTNNPNAALEFLKNNIERDTQQQIAEMGQKNNLLGHLTQQLGQTKDAAAFINMVKAQQLSNQLQLAAAKSKDPLAKARLNEQAGQLTRQFYPEYLGMQMKQAMIQASQLPDSGQRVPAMINSLRPFAPEVAKEMEGRYVPGIGLAQVPVSNEVRDELFKKQNLLTATENLRNWVKKNGGTLSPQKRAEGEAYALELQQLYRQGVGGSTSEGEQKIIDRIISSKPGAILEQLTVDPKLKALNESMGTSLNILKKQYGLPETHPEQVKVVNGIRYKRGPAGEAIRIEQNGF